MGCDIHMYAEYKRRGVRQDGQEWSWSSWGQRLNPGRNYFMFGLLSQGVRSDLKEGIPAKGPVHDLGWHAQNDAYIYIDDSPDDECDCEENYSVTTEKAMQWKESYGSHILEHNDKPWKVENPDWHSHSWLTPEEFETAIGHYNAHPEASEWPAPEYEALLAAMKSLEKHYEVRVVFWFDN